MSRQSHSTNQCFCHCHSHHRTCCHKFKNSTSTSVDDECNDHQYSKTGGVNSFCSPPDEAFELDEQTCQDLSVLREKACKFIRSESDCTSSADGGWHPSSHLKENCNKNINLVRKASDLVDYMPASEFLKKIKQDCKFWNPNPVILPTFRHNNTFDSYTYKTKCLNQKQITNVDQIRDVANTKVPTDPPLKNFSGCMCGLNPEDLGQIRNLCKNNEESYERHVNVRQNKYHNGSAHAMGGSRNLRDSSKGEGSKKTDKRSEHISRSKTVTRSGRGRRRQQSFSAEKSQSEANSEVNLKKPHENSCERCWRYASPARSPVNKPEQRYDPNFRKAHSCTDFQSVEGDAGNPEAGRRHISPCKNLQPVVNKNFIPLPEYKPSSPQVRELKHKPSSPHHPRSPPNPPPPPYPPYPQHDGSVQRYPDGNRTRDMSMTQAFIRNDSRPKSYTPGVRPMGDAYFSDFIDDFDISEYKEILIRPRRPPSESPEEYTRPSMVSPYDNRYFSPAMPEYRERDFDSSYTRSRSKQSSDRKSGREKERSRSKSMESPTPKKEIKNLEFGDSVSGQYWTGERLGQEQGSGWAGDRSRQRQDGSWPGERSFQGQSCNCSGDRTGQGHSGSRPNDRSRQRQDASWPNDRSRQRQDSSWPGDRSGQGQGRSRSGDRSRQRQDGSWPGERSGQGQGRSRSGDRTRQRQDGSWPGERSFQGQSCNCSGDRTGQGHSGSRQANRLEQGNRSNRPGDRTRQQDSSKGGRGSPEKNSREYSRQSSGKKSKSPKSGGTESPKGKKVCKSPLKTSPRNRESNSGISSSKSPRNQRASKSSRNRRSSKSPRNQRSKKSPPSRTQSSFVFKESLPQYLLDDSRPTGERLRPSTAPRFYMETEEAYTADVYPHPIRECRCSPRIPSFKPRQYRNPQEEMEGPIRCCHCRWREDMGLPPAGRRPASPQRNNRTEDRASFQPNEKTRNLQPPQPTRNGLPLNQAVRSPLDSRFSMNVPPKYKQSKGSSPKHDYHSTYTEFGTSTEDAYNRETHEDSPGSFILARQERVMPCPYLKFFDSKSPLKNHNSSNIPADYEYSQRERDYSPKEKKYSPRGQQHTGYSPTKYAVFYMTKCKENKGEEVEVLVEELTQTNKKGAKTKDLTDKMRRVLECQSDSMALRFQKGVSESCKNSPSSRVLYF